MNGRCRVDALNSIVILHTHGIEAEWQFVHLDPEVLKVICMDMLTSTVRPNMYALACEILKRAKKVANRDLPDRSDAFQRNTVSAMKESCVPQGARRIARQRVSAELRFGGC